MVAGEKDVDLKMIELGFHLGRDAGTSFQRPVKSRGWCDGLVHCIVCLSSSGVCARTRKIVTDGLSTLVSDCGHRTCWAAKG